VTRTEHTEHGELSLVELQQTLQLDIDPALLLLALTHRSFAYENGGIPTNERLEFLGDSILGQAVTVKLFRDHPELEEGELAKRRASLVSSAALAEVGRSIGVGPVHPPRPRRDDDRRRRQAVDPRGHGRGDHRRGVPRRRRRCGHGVRAAPRRAAARRSRAIRRGDGPEDEPAGDRRAPQRSAAVYTVTESGPDHNKHFVATVSVGELVRASGEGSSKKQAEMAAALEAWTDLNSR
jgi:ribonuclease-3